MATDLDWFERLTGFRELAYPETRKRLEIVGTSLRSKVNGSEYEIGVLEIPLLHELRQRAERAARNIPGRLKVTPISGEARALHCSPTHAKALFQVASQFNLLEMTGPSITPEHGVTRYVDDPTQGPACAVAAGAATIFRNYFAPVGGELGQTSDRQVDCLRDIGIVLGNSNGTLWEMRNGYALCSAGGLKSIEQCLRMLDQTALDKLRGMLRIGLHWSVQVTDSLGDRQLVSQAFCSALPVAYTTIPWPHWRAFASLVLEAAYEATLCAAAINAQEHGSRVVFLTRVGGGAFGNDVLWIDAAMRRALRLFEAVALDVRLVSLGAPPPEFEALARDFM